MGDDFTINGSRLSLETVDWLYEYGDGNKNPDPSLTLGVKGLRSWQIPPFGTLHLYFI